MRTFLVVISSQTGSRTLGENCVFKGFEENHWLVLKGILQNFHCFSFFLDQSNHAVASQNEEKHCFFYEKVRISRIWEGWRLIFNLLFDKKIRNISRLWASGNTFASTGDRQSSKRKTEHFHKNWKVGAQTSTKSAIWAIEAVLHERNSVEKTRFSKMIFCSLRGTSVLSWQDHVQKDKKRDRIASETLIFENSL